MSAAALIRITKKFLRNSPRTKRALQSIYLRYTPLTGDCSSLAEQLSESWLGHQIPVRQRAVVDEQLAAYRAGQPSPGFDALVETLLYNIPQLEKKSLLEVGCSTGYYSEVLRCRGVTVSYQGCDFSPAFIHLARQIYPGIPFNIEDATRLSYNANAFDIVVSGCCLLHILNYKEAIAEAARVARAYVVFHSTPVTHISKTSFYSKKAYGVRMFEIHFNEQELVRMFAAYGLRIVDVNSHLSLQVNRQAEPLIYKTYLCRKVQ
jgi:2-polyprenyl-3-methyl-5-hydroxy-6-metoxy-1,4-benzoquinol methylase